jgi:hypothetical protein
MQTLVATIILTVLTGLFTGGVGMVHRAEAQIFPIAVARICMQNVFGQSIDLRVYSASGTGPAGVWLVNGVYDLTITCQDPPSRFWPLHGSIVAKVSPKEKDKGDDVKAFIEKGMLFRLNFEAGSIDPSRNCSKFNEALTCHAEGDGTAPAVSCEGFFTNLGVNGDVTLPDVWSPAACVEDPEDRPSVDHPSRK